VQRGLFLFPQVIQTLRPAFPLPLERKMLKQQIIDDDKQQNDDSLRQINVPIQPPGQKAEQKSVQAIAQTPNQQGLSKFFQMISCGSENQELISQKRRKRG